MEFKLQLRPFANSLRSTQNFSPTLTRTDFQRFRLGFELLSFAHIIAESRTRTWTLRRQTYWTSATAMAATKLRRRIR